MNERDLLDNTASDMRKISDQEWAKYLGSDAKKAFKTLLFEYIRLKEYNERLETQVGKLSKENTELKTNFDSGIFNFNELYEIEKRFDFEAPILNDKFRASFNTFMMLEAKGDKVSAQKFFKMGDEYFNTSQLVKTIRDKCESLRRSRDGKK